MAMASQSARKGSKSAPQPRRRARPAEPRSFVSDITIEHGPADMLGRFFLKADTAARQRDVFLSFITPEEMLEINKANADTWRPVLPLFNPESSVLNEDNCYCMAGRNAKGEIIATQAGRLLPWSGTTFHDEASSLRLFYTEPEGMKAEGEEVIVTAPAARTLTGSVVFSGAIWYRPDYRGRQLPSIIPYISRAYAYTRWKQECTMSIMAQDVHARGMAERSGYNNVDWEVLLRRTPVIPDGDLHCAMVWMDSNFLLKGTADFLAGFDAQVDGRVGKRGDQKYG
jgi:hypothetical protein